MGLSQKQLAARLGVARATVWRWEAGVHPIEPLSARLLAILVQGAPAEATPGASTPAKRLIE